MKVLVFFAAGCVIASASLADTVFWYHFDDLADGVSATYRQQVLNSVDPDTFPGRLSTFVSLYDPMAESDNPGCCVKGAASLPSGWRIYDPVGGTRRPAGTSYMVQPLSMDNPGTSGCFVIDDADGSMRRESFTVECFFKSRKWHEGAADEADPNYEQYILSKTTESDRKSATTFSLILSAGGSIVVYMNYIDGATTNLVTKFSSGISYKDGKWHHAAVTYDDAKKEVCIYADYRLIAAETLPASAEPIWGSGPLSVGCRWYYSWGGLSGLVDDLRYSDVALKPDQMLRAERAGRVPPVDDDTLYYSGFSPVGDIVCGNGQYHGDVLVREAHFGSRSFGNIDILKAGSLVATDAAAFPRFMAGDFGTPVYTNEGAASWRSPVYGWTPAKTKMLDGDFTFETVIRFSEPNTDQAYIYAENGNVLTCHASGFLCLNWKKVSGDIVNDGLWHHIAVVYEKDVPRVRVYIDYRCVRTWEGTDAALSLPLSGDPGNLVIGGYWQGFGENIANADVDEMRITGRALPVAEFLHPNDGKTYCHCDFEPTSVAGLFSACSDAVSSFGSLAEAFSNAVPGAVTCYGLEGESVTNARSLYFKTAGGFPISDPDETVPSGSFTAEMSFRFKQGAWAELRQDSTYLFFQLGYWGVRYNKGNETYGPNIAFIDGDYKSLVTLYGNSSSGSHYPYDDGEWHTVAYVNDAENNERRCYIDGRLVATKAGKVVGTANVTDSSKNIWVNCGCWAYNDHTAGDFLMDNVRITKGALSPAEFLSPRRLEGATVHLSSFENDFRVTPGFFKANAASTGGSLFASSFREVLDAEGKTVRVSRRALKGVGEVVFDDNMLLARPHQTVEFFLKAKTLTDGTELLSLRTKDATKPVWMLRYSGGSLKLSVDADGSRNEVVSVPVASFGDRWMHCAVVFEPAQDGSKTAVSLYLDHAPAGAGVFGGQLAVECATRCSLAVGALGSQALIDEIRVSKGTVAVADMLYALGPRGLAVVVR